MSNKMFLLGEGTFGKVYAVGNRRVVKIFKGPLPARFTDIVLPRLTTVGALAESCYMDGGTLCMPRWGPTLWDLWKDSAVPVYAYDEVRDCLKIQLAHCLGLGLIHTDVKPGNIACTGGWPTGSVPEQLMNTANKTLHFASFAGAVSPGFILIDYDAVCPVEQIADGDRGTLCPFGPLLEERVKVPLLATYAMWFAAAATLQGFTPCLQVRCRAEFVAQHDQLAGTELLPPLEPVLAALDAIDFFNALESILAVPS